MTKAIQLAKQPAKECQPFKDFEGTWKVWTSKPDGSGYLRKLSKEEVQALHLGRRGVKQKKNKGNKKNKGKRGGRRRYVAATAKVEERGEAPADVRPVCISFPNGDEAEIAADGRVYHKPTAYGGSAYVGMTRVELLRRLTGDTRGYKVEPKMLALPDVQWMIEPEVMADWASRLLSFDTEALCVYGKLEDGRPTGDKPLWIAVVPKQEVSAASVDVDDFGPAIALLASRGYRRVGTIHTHPGNGVPHCSGVDEKDLWTGFGGIHYIVGRDGFVTTYYSLDGEHWDISREDAAVWRFRRLTLVEGQKIGCDTLLSQTGSVHINRVVKEKTWPTQYTSTRRTNLLTTPVAAVQTKKEGEKLYWLQGEWWIWNMKRNTLREATWNEVVAAGKRWEGPMVAEDVQVKESFIPPTGDTLDFDTNDSIVEVVDKLYKHLLVQGQPRLRMYINIATKEFREAWRKFETEVAAVKDDANCTGTLKDAVDIIVSDMFRIEVELIGVGTGEEVKLE